MELRQTCKTRIEIEPERARNWVVSRIWRLPNVFINFACAVHASTAHLPFAEVTHSQFYASFSIWTFSFSVQFVFRVLNCFSHQTFPTAPYSVHMRWECRNTHITHTRAIATHRHRSLAANAINGFHRPGTHSMSICNTDRNDKPLDSVTFLLYLVGNQQTRRRQEIVGTAYYYSYNWRGRCARRRWHKPECGSHRPKYQSINNTKWKH